jgi:1,4-dihydroxy-6-naphthoate synthase
MVVSKKPLEACDLAGMRIAVPGERTTALLALKLFLREQGLDKGFRYEVVPFDRIMAAVAAGEYDAGLIIHEGQLTYAEAGLRMVVDLGRWWTDRHGLPLPLGGNAIRRDLGQAAINEICTILLRSIRYALDHRREAVEYAMQFGRGMGRDLADKFVGMYVNQWTLDYGPRGREAVRKLLDEGAEAGITPACGAIDFAEPG